MPKRRPTEPDLAPRDPVPEMPAADAEGYRTYTATVALRFHQPIEDGRYRRVDVAPWDVVELGPEDAYVRIDALLAAGYLKPGRHRDPDAPPVTDAPEEG